MANNLEAEFEEAMRSTYAEASRLGYRPTYFLGMVEDLGGVGAAKRLLSTPVAQPGLARLWNLGRLDISAEALVLNERWRDLFTTVERQEARERLKAYGYEPSQE